MLKYLYLTDKRATHDVGHPDRRLPITLVDRGERPLQYRDPGYRDIDCQ